MPSTDPCVLAASRSGKRLLWLEDTSISLFDVGYVGESSYIDFQKARGRATARRRQQLVAAEKEGDAEALKKLALEECLQRRLIASEDGLEDLSKVRAAPEWARATDAADSGCRPRSSAARERLTAPRSRSAPTV